MILNFECVIGYQGHDEDRLIECCQQRLARLQLKFYLVGSFLFRQSLSIFFRRSNYAWALFHLQVSCLSLYYANHRDQLGVPSPIAVQLSQPKDLR